MLKTTPAVRPASILFRSLSVFLISALLVPAIVIGESGSSESTLQRASSRMPPKGGTPNAPPEPFHIGAASTTPNPFASFTATLTASLVSLTTSFRTSTAATTKDRSVNSDETTLPVEPVESEAEPNVESPAAPPPPHTTAVKFDFDGDGMADMGRWQVSSNEFLVRKSTNASFVEYEVGNYGAKIAPGDFNGDDFTDAGVFESGTWSYKTSPTATAQTITLGTTGDIPVAGYYDSDATTDAAVFRPSNSTWYIKQSTTSNTVSTTWGATGDIPVPGDYDGDGTTDIAVWRPSSGVWYIIGSTSGNITRTWGTGTTDMPVAADYGDDDNITDIAVFRRSTGVGTCLQAPRGFLRGQRSRGEITATSRFRRTTTETAPMIMPFGGQRRELGGSSTAKLTISTRTCLASKTTRPFRRPISSK